MGNKTKTTILTVGGYESRDEVLSVIEQYAKDSRLCSKNILRLRLLTEELLSLADTLFNTDEGKFWAEQEDRRFALHYKVGIPVGTNARSVLMSVASLNENLAYNGMTGKLRQVLDYLTDTIFPPDMSDEEYSDEINEFYDDDYTEDYHYERNYENMWSYQDYVQELNEKDKSALSDQLECSILTRLATNIEVYVRPNMAGITVYADFKSWNS